MDIPSTQDFAKVCRLFMALAYPDGLASIPESKRPYYTISDDASVADYLPPAPLALGICQDLSKLKGGVPGYEFRLGSADHPHLKLRIQRVESRHRELWVYSVDTHDRVAMQAAKYLKGDEAETWRLLLEKNSALKQHIEAAFIQAGYLTPTSLLKLDLTDPA